MMEKYKLDNFERENPGAVLDFQNLDLFVSGKVIGMLLSFLGYKSADIQTSKLYTDIQNSPLAKIEYGDEMTLAFLGKLLASLDIGISDTVFVIWDLKSTVDQFDGGILIRYWDYIWYDSSDEGIVLFIPNREIALFITEHGYASILRARLFN